MKHTREETCVGYLKEIRIGGGGGSKGRNIILTGTIRLNIKFIKM